MAIKIIMGKAYDMVVYSGNIGGYATPITPSGSYYAVLVVVLS